MKVDKPEPKYIYIKQTTETSIYRVKHEIITASIYDQLNTQVDANPNNNYEILDRTIYQIIKTCMPLKRVKFDKHKHTKIQLDNGWLNTINNISRQVVFENETYINKLRGICEH